ncbi:MAG TPA: FAD-dependent oxidoreductase [Chloroflexota bacterium]
MGESYDLVVVGGGSAGLTGAGLALQFGARVALVERGRLGGDCTWTGCVPSKTLLKSAKVAHQMKTASRYGLQPADVAIDLKQVMAHVKAVVEEVYQEETPGSLRADGAAVYLGMPHFLDPHTLAVGETTIEGNHFLIAAGAHPIVPSIPGLKETGYLTYETIWDLEELPEGLLVLGGGPQGCEFAQAFARLGSRVTMVTRSKRLLPRDEPEASAVLARVFASEGIELLLGASADHVRRDEKWVHVAAGGKEAHGSELLVATGRHPNVEGLDLKKAGVAFTAGGIRVDEKLRTSQGHIYAAGDCTGGPQFTHYAGWQAAMAVRNALLPGATKGMLAHVPWTTFTEPEVAHVGLTRSQARQQFGDDVMTCNWPMDRVDRARTDGETAGFLQLVHKRDGTLLGASVVAERAGETIQEWVVALDRGLKVGELSNVLHVYPTYATAGMQAAADVRVSRLMSGTSGKVIRGLARLLR